MDKLFSISDIIQLCGVFITLFAVITSIVIAVLTLRQNNKMIREETRPYISMYGALANFQSVNYYLVLRNFGKSSALISDFTTSVDFGDFSYHEGKTPFSHIAGSAIAPGQKIVCPIRLIDARKTVDVITVSVKYRWMGMDYEDISTINLYTYEDLVSVRASTKDAELKIISRTMQDIAERFL